MIRERVEEYLGAIYRLRSDTSTPLPLSHLAEYFGFSPVSVHEMVHKLDKHGWVVYHPYRGVKLTDNGEDAAQALLRRHRLWERFLTDVLDIAWDDAHVIAGRLEHAATELVTERLADFLGEPDSCPHGGPIPPLGVDRAEQCLRSLVVDGQARVSRISPETADRLQRVQAWELMPGSRLQVLEQHPEGTVVRLMKTGREVEVPVDDARAIWVGTA
ncbi:MAG: metal-dependent transcriptional regulator [Anaerolineae bacterium]